MLVSHVFSATEKTTKDPTSTTTTTDGLSKEVVVSIAVASTVLKIAILGLMVYLRWKRSQGEWSSTLLSPQLSQVGVSHNYLH